MSDALAWRTRAGNRTKPDFREATPQNRTRNITTPRTNREIVGQLEATHK